MPTWRKLYTKTVDSLDLADMPDDFTRLLWVLLPLQLDRCGRGIDNPAWVKSKIFPMRLDVGPEEVAEAMDWYEGRGMIERYGKNGRRYFWIPTWHKYQGTTAREGGSEIPAPDSYVDPAAPDEPVKTNSRPTHDQLTTNSSTDVDVDVDVEERGADAPSTPPAVTAFRENAHRFPAKSWWSDVDEVVGRDPPDVERWGQTVKAYVGQGWNPTNVDNMLTFYREKRIPGDSAKADSGIYSSIDFGD